MLKRALLCLGLLFLLTCDDGDIITANLEFDRDLSRCNNNEESFFIFTTREDPNEVIGIIIPVTEASIFEEATPADATPRPIDGINYRFIYRTYNRSVGNTDNNDDLCNVLPPSDLVIIEDFESPSGTIEILSTVEDDDQDGVATIYEGRGEPDADGNFPDAVDTDGDGIDDYLDKDDDGDNVPTIDEIDNSDGDDNPNTEPLDTDGDGRLDYLDEDDDGDGVQTILEDENGDRDPRNDINNDMEGNLVPNYLNTIEVTAYDDQGPNQGNAWRSYQRIVTTNFTIINFDLQLILGDSYFLGSYENPITVNPD